MSVAIPSAYSSVQPPFVFNKTTNPKNSAYSTPSTAAAARGDTDRFVRSSAGFSVQNTYNAIKNAVNATRSAQDITTLEGRQQAAKDYDAILADLRKTYAEPEAMRRFDEIMRADGFERVEYADSSVPPMGNNPYKTEGATGYPVTLTPAEYSDVFNKLPQDRTSANMLLHSTLGTVMRENGDPAVAAESWAIYGADRPYSDEMREAWQNRYKDSVQSQVDFDVDAYLGSVNPFSPQSSAVAANTDLAAMASDILAKNNIKLGEGEYLSFHLDPDGNMYVKGGEGLTELFSKEGAFVNAFKQQMANPPLEAPEGSYEDGERSIEYQVNRSIVFRPDEPSAAVMIDNLAVVNSGYTYVKKAGEYFDPNASSHSFNTQALVYDVQVKGIDRVVRNQSQKNAAAHEKLSAMLESGERIEGEVPYAEVEKARAKSQAEWEEWRDNLPPMYEALPEGSDLSKAVPSKNLTGADAAPEAEEEKTPEPEEPPEPEKPVYLEPEEPLRDGIDKMADFRKIVAEINTKYHAVSTLLRPLPRGARYSFMHR